MKKRGVKSQLELSYTPNTAEGLYLNSKRMLLYSTCTVHNIWVVWYMYWRLVGRFTHEWLPFSTFQNAILLYYVHVLLRYSTLLCSCVFIKEKRLRLEI